MLYTIPDYYKEFACTADKCEDTCCAGWQIVIDQHSLHKYQKVKGEKGRIVHSCIDWKEQVFKQDSERRCAFLNENNLCSMYQMLGKNSLCRTCRLYPRHIEEFEGVREVSLSLSCPEVARILMRKKEPVHFQNYEKPGEDQYEDFDPFLYSALVDVREQVIQILQDRSQDMNLRMMMALVIAHDMQVHVSREQLFSCADIPRKYQTEAAKKYVEDKLRQFMQDDIVGYEFARRTFRHLYKLEVLNPNWQYRLLEAEQILYGHALSVTGIPEQAVEIGKYCRGRDEFAAWVNSNQIGDNTWEILREQLMVYFVFTYFCGAVYDGRIYAKMQMAAFSVFIIEELLRARWIKNEWILDLEDVVETVYQYSREIEHSDQNLETLEKLMEGDRWIWVRKQ